MEAFEINRPENPQDLRDLLSDQSKIPEDLHMIVRKILGNQHLFNFFEYIYHATPAEREEAVDYYANLASYSYAPYSMALDIVRLAEELEPKPVPAVIPKNPISMIMESPPKALKIKIVPFPSPEQETAKIRKQIEQLTELLHFLEKKDLWIQDIAPLFQALELNTEIIQRMKREKFEAMVVAEEINADEKLRNDIILKIREKIFDLQNRLPKNNKQLPPASSF